MNTSLSTRSPGPRTGTGSGAGYGRRTERGIAVLVILTLLACMAILVAANSWCPHPRSGGTEITEDCEV